MVHPPVRIALVGCGVIGDTYLTNVARWSISRRCRGRGYRSHPFRRAGSQVRHPTGHLRRRGPGRRGHRGGPQSGTRQVGSSARGASLSRTARWRNPAGAAARDAALRRDPVGLSRGADGKLAARCRWARFTSPGPPRRDAPPYSGGSGPSGQATCPSTQLSSSSRYLDTWNPPSFASGSSSSSG